MTTINELKETNKSEKRLTKKDATFALELSKQVQRLVMVDFPRALPTQTLTWS